MLQITLKTQSRQIFECLSNDKISELHTRMIVLFGKDLCVEFTQWVFRSYYNSSLIQTVGMVEQK